MHNVTLSAEQLQQEMHDIHIVHASCLFWRMRALAHRLLEFGYESAVNHLSVPESLVLATLLPPYMHDEIVRSAYAVADDRWKSFIAKHVPHLAQEPAHV